METPSLLEAHTNTAAWHYVIHPSLHIKGGRTGGPPFFDLCTWTLRTDNWLLHSLSRQPPPPPPRSYFCSVATAPHTVSLLSQPTWPCQLTVFMFSSLVTCRMIRLQTNESAQKQVCVQCSIELHMHLP